MENARPSWRCMRPSCEREPNADGECWLCPEHEKELRARAERAEANFYELNKGYKELIHALRPVNTGDCTTCADYLPGSSGGSCRSGNDTRRASCCYHSRARENDAYRNAVAENAALRARAKALEDRLKERVDQCCCRHGGIGAEGLCAQPCDKCDADRALLGRKL